MKDVDAVLCGLCTVCRPYEFQILWEAGKESPPFATVTLLAIIVAIYILLCPLGDAVLAKWGSDPTGGLDVMHAKS
jgi:hypothetical protein